ncbi:MAG TPA: hypothetical protein VI727_07775 [Candidatus Brocadiaceae bacterium]|nr:hypothetical protein [Candidatus Brocadiaceae bacterium]
MSIKKGKRLLDEVKDIMSVKFWGHHTCAASNRVNLVDESSTLTVVRMVR